MGLMTPLQAALRGFKNGRREARHKRRANGSFRIIKIRAEGLEGVRGNYLITTEKGVFGVIHQQLYQLFAGNSFGIALRDGELFLATSTDFVSRIIRTRLPEAIEAGRELTFRELAQFSTAKHGRVHQVTFFQDRLVVCNTGANSLVFVDPETGRVEREIHPIVDTFGHKIGGAHNHLNSVSVCGGVLLFCAYRAGPGSLLGLVYEDRVRGYAVERLGAHDIYVSGEDIYYCDTFGARTGAADGCGYLMVNNRKFDENFFTTPTGYALRGLSKTGDELIIGHSHKGDRRKRFKGQGSLIRCVGNRAVEELPMPFAQVYDVVELNGSHFDVPPAVTAWEEVNNLFESVFGKPAYDVSLAMEEALQIDGHAGRKESRAQHFLLAAATAIPEMADTLCDLNGILPG
jgi:hypothetical protein